MLIRIVWGILFLVNSMGFIAAQERRPEVTAKLRFNLWVTSKPMGIQVAGNREAKNERYKGSFYLKRGEEFVEVKYRQGRRTGVISYRGLKKCVLYKKGTGDTPYVAMTEFMIPQSGEYMIMLKVSGDVKKPHFFPYLIPQGMASLKKNSVLFVNYTDSLLGIKLDADKRMTLMPNEKKIMHLSVDGAKGAKVRSGMHLEVYSKSIKKMMWKMLQSRVFAVGRKSKSVCVLYRENEDGPVKLKFFSGLE